MVDASAGNILFLVLAIILLFISLGLFWFVFKKLLSILKTVIVNSIVGLVAVVILGWLGVQVPLNTLNLLVIAFFGLPGLAVLLLLMFFGVL